MTSPDSFAGLTPRPGLRDRLRLPEGVLGAAAAVLAPLGVMVIVLGWYGASHTPYLFEQVPYLISGGLVGLALVVAGGLAYFGSWIARGAAAQQRSADELAGLLREIRDELVARPAAEPAPSRRRAASNGSNGSSRASAADLRSGLVATASGSMLHRPDCSIVAGREDLHAVAAGSGLRPCGMCDPLSVATP